MAVISFLGFTPIERADGIPFLFVDIYESITAQVGSWTKIDEKALVDWGGIDTDPSNPMPRNITTVLATLDTDGWYKLVWRDAFGNTSETDPIHATRHPAVPSADSIRERMPRIEWTEMGYAAPTPGEDDPLEFVIVDSVSEFQLATGQNPYTLTPGDPLTALAAKALRFMVAFNANRETQEILETSTDFDLLGSLSQGPASESRRSMGGGKNTLHPSPVIDRLLRDFIKALTAGVATLDHVPGVDQGLGRLPRPGQFVMEDPKRVSYDLAASIYGSLPMLGVALYLGSG